MLEITLLEHHGGRIEFLSLELPGGSTPRDAAVDKEKKPGLCIE